MISETTICTNDKTQLLDVTRRCQEMIGSAENGIAVYNILHTTAALIVCENEADLLADIVKVAENWLADFKPFRHGRYSNPNAAAHILSAFAGTSLTIPIIGGKLRLGAWQSIMLLELDGPKKRQIICTTIETAT